MLCIYGHHWFEREIRAVTNKSNTVRNIKHESYEERLSTLNLMSTLNRWDRGERIMTYNILNHRVAMDARFMKMNTKSRASGHTKKLKISRSQIEIRRHFFTNRIMKRWNGLSQEIINSKTIDAFKRACDQEQRLIKRPSTMRSWLTGVSQLWYTMCVYDVSVTIMI